MCGRYALTYEQRQLIERYNAQMQHEFHARYNVAPSQAMPIITSEDPKHIIMARWGLIPHWAKDEKIGYRMINARAETLKEKRTFKGLLEHKRCIIPASHFYEWKKTSKGKQPFAFHFKNNKIFSFAGLYSVWQGELVSFTIITTEASKTVEKIHDRMPVILTKAEEKKWLKEPNEKLLDPFESKTFEAYKISKLVNIPKNESPEILIPA